MNLQRSLLTSFAAVMLLSAFVPREVQAQAAKLAVVDLQRAIAETEDGRKAKDKLKTLFDSRQKGLDAKQEELKKLKEEIEKQQKVLSRDAMEAKMESYQKQLMELQQVYVENQRELADKEGELTRQIVERMEKILRRIGQTEGYTMIVERNEAGVIYVPTNLDLTDVVIQRYNAGEGKEPVSAAPKTMAPKAAGAKAPAAAPAVGPKK